MLIGNDYTYALCSQWYFTVCTVYSLVSPSMASHSSPLSPDEVTRVVYYLDKDETPYRTSIPKRSVTVSLTIATLESYVSMINIT